MKKKNLFIDFDGMKFDTLPVQVSYINSHYGINTSLSEYINNGDGLDSILKKHIPNFNLSWEECYINIVDNFHASINWHENIPPMQDMCEVIMLLAKKYTLYTVTARPKSGKNVVRYLLDKHVPDCISGIHCVWDYVEGVGFVESSKKNFIQNMEGENIAFLDDSPNEIRKIQNIIPSYLFDPMDLHANEGMNRVSTWMQIGETFL